MPELLSLPRGTEPAARAPTGSTPRVALSLSLGAVFVQQAVFGEPGPVQLGKVAFSRIREEGDDHAVVGRVAGDLTGAFRYSRRDRALTLLAYTVWTSTDLVTWTEDEGAEQSPDAPGVPRPKTRTRLDATPWPADKGQKVYL